MSRSMFLWVTRSSPYNFLTGHRLRAMGHKVLTVPALGIRPVKQPPLQRRPDAILFTSAQAVRHHGFEARFRNARVFAVGDGTARAARRCGYTNVCSAQGDVHALRTLIGETLDRPAYVVHHCARETAGNLTGDLETLGFEAERRMVYESREAGAADLAGAGAAIHLLDGIVVHSPRGGRRVAGFVGEARWQGVVFCLSPACAHEFRELPGLSIETSPEPDESSLMSLVRRFRGRVSRMPARPGGLRLVSAAPRMLHVANDDGEPDEPPPTAA